MKVLGFGSGVETAPGVYTTERDLTQTPAAGASTEAATAGLFAWGPANSPTLIDSEEELVRRFGKPSSNNAESFFAASQFLAYADKLYINRVLDTATRSAVANNATANAAAVLAHTIENRDDYENKEASFSGFPAVDFAAKFPGAAGNSLRLSIAATPEQFQSTINLATGTYGTSNIAFIVGSSVATVTMSNTTNAAAVIAMVVPGDVITAGNTSIGTQQLRVRSVGALSGNTVSITMDAPFRLSTNVSQTTLTRAWEYSSLVSGTPKTGWYTANAGSTAVDTIHAVVVDEAGVFTGRPGSILEVFEHLSRATDSKTPDGEINFFRTAINRQSDYIWVSNATGLTTGLASTITSLAANFGAGAPLNLRFNSGVDGANETSIPLAPLLDGYRRFAHKDEYDLSAVIVAQSRGGTFGEQVLNYVIDNVAEIRKDIVAYGSLPRAVVVNNRGNELNDAKNFRSAVRNSSYAFLDSGFKYTYDKYNDVFRWVPLCGDIAGLSARTDVTDDPWISPAGFNRGQIKNVIKLAWNPSPAEQKVSFSVGINNVLSIKNDGTYLMGDKTLIGVNSALDQIGTRKMLNILKGTLSRAARSLLFEQNDEFTQARFKNLVDPYMRDVQGRRGIKWFRSVADQTNNTEFVENSNRFVGDIFFQATRSIRTVQLNFVSTGSSVEFNEVV